MIVKLGDLVQVKLNEQDDEPCEKDQIWLVIGFSNWSNYIRVQNVRNGYKCQYNIALLQHFKSDKN